MSATPTELAAQVDAAVRLIPGVEQLYFAAPLPARLWNATVAREETYSVVVRRDGILEATVSIGVAHERADTVARGVADRVRTVLGDPAAKVTVRVSRLAAS